MSSIQAILFCGGRGTRLYPVTDYYQKVMMPLGQEGRPMLEYVIRHLSSFGITEYIALIRYRANQIRRYFGTGEKFGVNIEYILDNPNFKGTGGALYNARNSITADNLLIYYTDILSNINIEDLIDFHEKHNKLATAWIDPSWEVDEGIIEMDSDNQIKQLHHVPKDSIFANTGISILNKDTFQIIEELMDHETGFLDLSGDIFPNLVQQKQILAYMSDEWWLDVGSLSRHQKVDDELLKHRFRFLEG